MQEIENKVVSMDFDNQKFEAKVRDTLKTLDDLKKSLKFDGISKGIEHVNESFSRLNFSGLNTAIETVNSKFSALGIAGVTAISNITNMAMSAGKRIVKSLTIDPIKTGFQEYELKMGSIQTILANTKRHGSTLKDVNKALNDLNTYSDQTIYNFAQMTKAIGMFTTAGVELKTSTNSVKGIANLAAFVGAPAEDASRAMYQLSQALSTGSVRLQDWMSLEHTAGMGGKEFQTRLIDTARVMGTGVDAALKKYGNFRESLKTGWLSTDVLTATLSQFAGDVDEKTLKKQGFSDKQIADIIELGKTATDAATKVKTVTQLYDTLKESVQSGWAATWELIVGDFENAKSSLTEIKDMLDAVISKSANNRNQILKEWNKLEGREDLLNSIKELIKVSIKLKTIFRDTFKSVLNIGSAEKSAKTLKKISSGLLQFMDKVSGIFNDPVISGSRIPEILKGLMTPLAAIKNVISSVIRALSTLKGTINIEDIRKILAPLSSIGYAIYNIHKKIEDSDILYKILVGNINLIKSGLLGIKVILSPIISGISKLLSFLSYNIVDPSKMAIASLLANSAERMKAFNTEVYEFIDKISESFSKLWDKLTKSPGFKALKAIWASLYNSVKSIGGAILTFIQSLSASFAKADFNQLFDLINTISFAAISKSISGFFNSIKKGKKDVKDSPNLLLNIKNILDSLKDCLVEYQKSIRANIILKIAVAIGILSTSLILLSGIDSKRLAASVTAIGGLFGELVSAFAIVSKINTTATLKSGFVMIAMSIAINKLAKALYTISDLDFKDIMKGLVGIYGLFGALAVGMSSMKGIDGSLIKTAASVMIVSMALQLMSKAVKKMGELSISTIIEGLASVALMLTMLSLYSNHTYLGQSMSEAMGLVILAGALNLIVIACERLGSMPIENIVKGVASIGAILLELGLFSKMFGDASTSIKMGISIILLASSLVILSKAMETLGTLSWRSMGVGLISIGTSLGLITAALNLMPKNTLSLSAGLLAISFSISILASSMKKMGSMSWEKTGRALITFGGSLAILTAALHAMKGTASGAGALMLASVALSMLVPPLMLLGSMSWEHILKSLSMLAGVMTILGVSAAVFHSLAPIIVALAGAVGLLGLGLAAMGAGFLLSAAAVTILVAAMQALTTVSGIAATSIVAVLTVVLTGLIDLIPLVITKIGEGLIAVLDIIAGSFDSIMNAIKTILLAVIEALIEVAPRLIALLGIILTDIINLLIEQVPALVEAVLVILVAILKSLKDHIKDITAYALEFIAAFIDGIVQGLPKVIQSGINMIISFIEGLADGIRKNTDRMIKAVNKLMSAIIYAIGEWLNHFKEKGSEFILNIIEGLKKKKEELKTKLKDIIEEGVEKLRTKLTDFKEIGKDAIQGLINGFRSKIEEAKKAATDVGESVYNAIKNFLKINSPSKMTFSLGKFTDIGFANGINKYASYAERASKNMAENMYATLKDPMDMVANGMLNKKTYHPSIVPVINYGNLNDTISEISNDKIFGHMLSTELAGTISNPISINGSNQDIIKELHRLRADINKINPNIYSLGNVTYSDNSTVYHAIENLIDAIKMEERV